MNSPEPVLATNDTILAQHANMLHVYTRSPALESY
jgi:hypothetical protein